MQFRGGPLTIAEYMSEVLTHPTEGYYTTREHVFGSSGDFVTSPDISQMFGEMIGIWCVAMWQQLGCPKKLMLAELGPGKGTLMADVLRGTAPFKDFNKALEVHLVEVSPRLRSLQAESLGCQAPSSSSSYGPTVTWWSTLDDVPSPPDTPVLYIGHEFLDALPVHQFVKKPNGSWHEVVVDICKEAHDPKHFRLVLSPHDTFASKTVLPSRLQDIDRERIQQLDSIEISPACIGLADGLATRVAQQGGAALLIDYGQDGPYENSIVAIKNHKFVDLLSHPGQADVSAYVDFDAMRTAVKSNPYNAIVDMHGPIDQSVFLKSLGIDSRLQSLMEVADAKQQQALLDGYKRLIGSPGMGDRYKAICIGSKTTIPITF